MNKGKGRKKKGRKRRGRKNKRRRPEKGMKGMTCEKNNDERENVVKGRGKGGRVECKAESARPG